MRPRKMVLLVEANELRRSLWTFLLDNWGYAVIAAPSPGEALRLVRGEWTYDVVMCDFATPEMAGDELARRVKELRAEIRVLVFSELIHVRELAAGHADAYLMGDYSRSDLMKALKVLCARKRGPKKRVVPVAVGMAVAS